MVELVWKGFVAVDVAAAVAVVVAGAVGFIVFNATIRKRCEI